MCVGDVGADIGEVGIPNWIIIPMSSFFWLLPTIRSELGFDGCFTAVCVTSIIMTIYTYYPTLYRTLYRTPYVPIIP